MKTIRILLFAALFVTTSCKTVKLTPEQQAAREEARAKRLEAWSRIGFGAVNVLLGIGLNAAKLYADGKSIREVE